MAVSERAASPAGPGRYSVRNPYSALPNWLYPAFVALALTAFGVYTAWVVLLQPVAQFGQYLSPFDSPLITLGAIPAGIFGRSSVAGRKCVPDFDSSRTVRTGDRASRTSFVINSSGAGCPVNSSNCNPRPSLLFAVAHSAL